MPHTSSTASDAFVHQLRLVKSLLRRVDDVQQYAKIIRGLDAQSLLAYYADSPYGGMVFLLLPMCYSASEHCVRVLMQHLLGADKQRLSGVLYALSQPVSPVFNNRLLHEWVMHESWPQLQHFMDFCADEQIVLTQCLHMDFLQNASPCLWTALADYVQRYAIQPHTVHAYAAHLHAMCIHAGRDIEASSNWLTVPKMRDGVIEDYYKVSYGNGGLYFHALRIDSVFSLPAPTSQYSFVVLHHTQLPWDQALLSQAFQPLAFTRQNIARLWQFVSPSASGFWQAPYDQAQNALTQGLLFMTQTWPADQQALLPMIILGQALATGIEDQSKTQVFARRACPVLPDFSSNPTADSLSHSQSIAALQAIGFFALPAPATHVHLPLGAKVRLSGLKAAQFNHQEGEIVAGACKPGRVRLDDGRCIQPPVRNVALLPCVQHDDACASHRSP